VKEGRSKGVGERPIDPLCVSRQGLVYSVRLIPATGERNRERRNLEYRTDDVTRRLEVSDAAGGMKNTE
jgi:hypothetical protein